MIDNSIHFFKRFFIVGLVTLTAHASTAETMRTMQLSNDHVSVWKTIIYPAKEGILPMHRHDNPRLLVALTDGVLRVTTDQGQSHDLILKKNTAYYLDADQSKELHQDENLGKEPIEVMVIELKSHL